MNYRKKILIVGGTGFIGYHLAKKGIKKGWAVTSASSRKPQKVRYLKKVKYIISDITNKNSLKRIKGNFDYVVNLGGYVNHAQKKKTYQSHYIGCKNLANFFLNKKISSFVQIGSSVEYGKNKSPHNENLKCNLKTVFSTYGKSKLLATKYLLTLFMKKNFPVTILRLYLTYGERADENRFLPIIINGCIKNKKFPVSEGKQLRDFVHVNDVVDAIIKSLLSKNSKGEIINIGSGKPKKIRYLINKVKKILKTGLPQFGELKLRKDEILKLYPSIEKAKKIIKWSPKVDFEKGLKSTIEYYKHCNENRY